MRFKVHICLEEMEQKVSYNPSNVTEKPAMKEYYKPLAESSLNHFTEVCDTSA